MLNNRSTLALIAGLALLVAFAAGVGAYLAVRDNGRSSVTPAAEQTAVVSTPPAAVSETTTPTEGTADAVESTEGVIVPADTAPADAPTPAATTPTPVAPASAPEPPAPVEPRSTTPPAGPGPARTPEAVASPAPAPATRASRDLPDIDGWEPVGTPWPSAADDIVIDIDATAIDVPVAAGPPPPVIAPVYEELTLAADSVVGLQLDSFVTTEVAQIEDDVQARVTRDVLVDGDVAVPAGTMVMGSVVLVEQGGKIKGASRLGVRFHTIVFDDGVEVPMVTETVYREGRSRGGESAAKIGGAAVGGAILGAIFGGGRGAAIGGAAGAAGGTAAAVAGEPEPATLPAGTTITVRLSRPATVTVER